MAISLKEDSFREKFGRICKLMDKIDDEIDYIGTLIAKKKDECEKVQRKLNLGLSLLNLNICDGVKRPNLFMIAEQIYAENKEKVAKNEEVFDGLGPRLKLPLYNLPQDTLIYHQNIKAFEKFKHRLVNFIAHKKTIERNNLSRMIMAYDSKMRDHINRVNAIEDSYEWKMVQANRRSLFCQTFPELWKQQYSWQGNKKVKRKKRPAMNTGLSNSYSHSEIFVFHNRSKNEMMNHHAIVPQFVNHRSQMDLKFFLINNNNRLVVNLSEEIKNEKINENIERELQELRELKK